MSIRAKFYVQQVANVASQGGGSPSELLTLSAVYGKDNEPWSRFTPSGTLTMTITNPEAMGRFKPGQTVYIDVQPADE